MTAVVQSAEVQVPENLPEAMPQQIILHQLSQVLEVIWVEGDQVSLTSTELRSACRCSACDAARLSGSTSGRTVLNGLIQSTVAITEVRRFGVAGIQCVFSDGHDRGVFPWGYLKSLGAGRDQSSCPV